MASTRRLRPAEFIHNQLDIVAWMTATVRDRHPLDFASQVAKSVQSICGPVSPYHRKIYVQQFQRSTTPTADFSCRSGCTEPVVTLEDRVRTVSLEYRAKGTDEPSHRNVCPQPLLPARWLSQVKTYSAAYARTITGTSGSIVVTVCRIDDIVAPGEVLCSIFPKRFTVELLETILRRQLPVIQVVTAKPSDLLVDDVSVLLLCRPAVSNNTPCEAALATI